MEGVPVQKVARLARKFAADAVAVGRALPWEMRQWYELLGEANTRGLQQARPGTSTSTNSSGAPWPCPKDARLGEVLADIGGSLGSRDVGFGRDTYGLVRRRRQFAMQCCSVRHTTYPARGRD